MKKFLRILGVLVGVAMLVILAYMLVLKVKKDTTTLRNEDIIKQNTQAEAEYLSTKATNTLKSIIDKIETELKVNIEVADVGSLETNDIYFVTNVEGQHMYIVKEVIDEKDSFKIASDNFQDAKYIISLKTIGLDERIYTRLEDYVIDKEGNITYNENK